MSLAPLPSEPFDSQTRLLQGIATLAGLPLEEKMGRVLEQACRILKLESGVLSRITRDECLVIAAHNSAERVSLGDTVQLPDVVCGLTLRRGEVVALDGRGAEPDEEAQRFAAAGVAAYIGAPVMSDGRLFGTLCLYASEARAEPFTQVETGLVQFLASWMGTAVERMEATEALQRSERQMARTLQAAPDAVVVATEDRTIGYVNPAFERLFRISAKEVCGRATTSLYKHAADHASQGEVRFNSDARLDPTPYVVTYQRADGTTFLGETVGGRIGVDGDARYLIGFIRDVTDRETSREAAEAKVQARAEAVRSKERFLANMSHEMRTPLNAVLGLSHLLRQTSLSENQTELLEGVQTSANALLSLIDDVLNFARLEADEFPLESIPFSPKGVADEVRTILLPRAMQQSLTLTISLTPRVPATVVGDPTRLRQVLVNLGSNAVKFTLSGSVTILMDAEVGARGAELRIEIEDTGIGIPPERMEAIFSPFTQAADDSARRFGGTGLGLAIAKELIERQGGDIQVQSAEGQGSTFRVRLPVRLPASRPPTGASAPPRAATEKPRPTEPADLSGLRVLVVDDYEMNRLVARRTLQLWGIDVTEAHGGLQAIRLLESSEQPFDLVLMDLQMPEMDGIEVTRYIRTQLGLSSEDLPVLAFTASVLAYEHADAMAAGLDDYLLKPFDPAVLRERLSLWSGRETSASDADPAAPRDRSPALHASPNPALLREVTAMFLSGGLRSVQSLAAAASQGDLVAVAAAAHKLKGLATYAGALDLSDSIDEIVQAARAGQRTGIVELVQTALRRYRAAANELKRVQDGDRRDARVGVPG